MKKILFFSFALLAVIFYSCAKEDNINNQKTDVAKTRSTDYRTCGILTFGVVYQTLNDSCCKAIVTVTSTHPNGFGRQLVYIDNVFSSFLTGGPTKTFEYTLCNGASKNFKVYGFNLVTNLWDDLCFETTLKCNTPPSSCCDSLKIQIKDCGAGANGCCNFEYKFTNNSNCPLSILYTNGTPTAIPANSTVTLNISICPSEIQKVLSVLDENGVVCKKFIIRPLCNVAYTCNGTLNASAQITTDGCCRIKFTAYNGGTTVMYLYDSSGVLYATLNPGDTYNGSLKLCKFPTRGLVLYLGENVGSTQCAVCKSFDLAALCGN